MRIRNDIIILVRQKICFDTLFAFSENVPFKLCMTKPFISLSVILEEQTINLKIIALTTERLNQQMEKQSFFSISMLSNRESND